MARENQPRKLCIAFIAHALVLPVNRARWKRLAQDPRYEVHLIVPKYWEQTWFGEKVVYRPDETHEDNYHVHTLATTSVHNWKKYFFLSPDGRLRRIKPDIIYIIQEESILIHHQIYFYRRLFAPRAKIIFFSMNAGGIPYQTSRSGLKRFIHKRLWHNTLNNTEAALAHYPGCLDSLRGGGYHKPVYLQTQMGVNEAVFAADQTVREKHRRELGFSDSVVIGYAGRLIPDKGVDDLWRVFLELASHIPNLCLLMIGNGKLRDEIEAEAENNGLSERAHVTGFVELPEVAAYMNAMDMLVLASKTMPYWIDTFPRTTIQAQSIGIPVVGSDSGSLPWQLADSALLFPEGDREALRQRLTQLIADPGLRQSLGRKGQTRCHQYFSVKSLNESFKRTLDQVETGEYIFHQKDEPYVPWKAY